MNLTFVKKHLFIFIILISYSSDTNLIAQGSARHPICLTLPEIAIVDIEPSNSPINLSLEAPIESGEGIFFQETDATKWINYTSAIGTGSSNRFITAQLSEGTVPDGIQLFVEAKGYQGSGGGNLGNPTGNLLLVTKPQVIISDIGRSFTGNGSNGHQLVYSLAINNYGQLRAINNQKIRVVFTITD